MQKLRISRPAHAGTLALIVVFTFICYYFYDLHRQQAEAETQRRDATFRVKTSLDASALVILSEVAQVEEIIAQRNLAAVCVGNSRDIFDSDIVDPDPELIRRLKTSIPKIRPYSFCRSLTNYENVIVYTITPVHWETPQRIEIAERRTDSVRQSRGVSEYYDLTFINDKWVVEKHNPGPVE